MTIEPTETEILQDAMESRLLDVHTAIPAKILSYDRKTQTAEVQIVVNAPLEVRDGSIVQEELPIIPNVKVRWPRAGGFTFHFPLQPDDHVLLVFCEASIADWRETGEVGDVGDLRRHNLTHAIAIPGIAPDDDPIDEDDVPDDEAVLNGPDIIRLGSKLAAQFVALSNLVDSRLEDIRAFVNAHVHPTGVGPSGPVDSSKSPGISSPLAALESVAAAKVKCE